MAWELLDDGSWNGLRKWMRAFDDDEGTVEIKYEDVRGEQILEENKQAGALNKRSEFWHVGHIPASLGMKWLVEEGIDMWDPNHADAVKKKLMDSDYRHLVPGLNRIIL